MGMEKIFFGVVIIVIAIAVWGMISSDALNVFISTPAARFAFREAFSSFQFIYFLISISLGVGIIIWGAQS